MKLLLLILFPALAFSQIQVADVVFTNAKVWTVDPGKPVAQSVAVRGDRIIAVGTQAEIRSVTGPKTTLVNLEGRLMLPGFIDNHTHFSSGGFQLQNVDLRDAANEREFTRGSRKGPASIRNGGSQVEIGITTTGPAGIFQRRNWLTKQPPRRRFL